MGINNSKLLKVYLADLVLVSESNQESQELLNERMGELKNLVNTFGGMVICKKIQKKIRPDYRTYLGKGKIEEIKLEMEANNIDLLIIGNILKPSQIYNINEILNNIGVKAWDRIDLILQIFEKHANTVEARLQIALAAIKHMGPRIFGMGLELSRQAGGIGTKGIGETNLEIMRRHLKEKEKKIKDKLIKYSNTRSLQRENRLKNNFKSVGIVGYTNVGKSSLHRALTKKKVLVENKLFATLSTNIGKIYYPDKQNILLIDTIGFIRDLPPSLIQAFTSTLEDSINSQLLLHLIDASDSNIQNKIEIVIDILKQIKATQHVIHVFNKIDLINSDQLENLKIKYGEFDPVFISIEKNIGLEELKTKIFNSLLLF